MSYLMPVPSYLGFCRRAHGHTAEEQTQLNRNRRMSIHLSQLQEMLEEQSNDLKVCTKIFQIFGLNQYSSNCS